MADKALARIEAKLDALLKEHNIKPDEVTAAATPAPRAARQLTAAEQQAIDNAPKTPIGANGPADAAPRTDAATNAPNTGSSVPADAEGPLTIETTQPDGSTSTTIKPAGRMGKP